MVQAISGEDTYVKTRADFRKRFAPLDDGNAAARVVDEILASHPLPGA